MRIIVHILGPLKTRRALLSHNAIFQLEQGGDEETTGKEVKRQVTKMDSADSAAEGREAVAVDLVRDPDLGPEVDRPTPRVANKSTSR